tara:strand:- start:273 stop:431 length:159 start_codon:yes stop_codon:yes gene_type:complete
MEIKVVLDLLTLVDGVVAAVLVQMVAIIVVVKVVMVDMDLHSPNSQLPKFNL